MVSDDTTEESSLVTVSKDRGLATRSATFAERGLELLANLGRLVHFPLDGGIGDVYLFDRSPDIGERVMEFDADDPERGLFSDMERIDNVAGDLRVPNGKYLLLVTNFDSDFSLLSGFAADSIDGISRSALKARMKASSTSFDLYPEITDDTLFYLSGLKSLTYLDLSESYVTGSGLSHLSNLSSLAYLDLSGSDLTDTGLAHLSSLKSLRMLRLARLNLTDEGLSHLSGLTSLIDLDLGWPGQGVTDDCLSHISNLTSLTNLNLAMAMNITDLGLRFLSRLTSLTSLEFFRTRVTGTGFSHLSNPQSLRRLGLSGSKVSDKGLEYVSKLASLEHLDVSWSDITDVGLSFLVSLKSLNHLDLHDTKITDDGIRKLRTSLPDCEIFT
jgi:Leucine-rich repeat (LRR) protein